MIHTKKGYTTPSGDISLSFYLWYGRPAVFAIYVTN